MRIPSRTSTTPAGPAGAASRRAGPGGFALPEAGCDAAQPATPLAAPVAASSVFAAEAIGQAAADAAPLTSPAEATRQGKAVLQALGGLQLAALGQGGAEARQALAALARPAPQVADPRLQAVLKAIAQRAAVELAKQG